MLSQIVLNTSERKVCATATSSIRVGTLIANVSVDSGVAVASQTTTFNFLTIAMKVCLSDVTGIGLLLGQGLGLLAGTTSRTISVQVLGLEQAGLLQVCIRVLGIKTHCDLDVKF